MNLWLKFYLKWNGELVGSDQFGNQYYQEKKLSHKKIKRRFVLFHGKEEASKIPPLWHSWMHYTSDDVPNNLSNEQKNRPSFMKDHLPNLTATPLAHHPKAYHFDDHGHLIRPDYTAWNPN